MVRSNAFILMLIILLIIIAAYVALAVYVYKDAKKHNMNQLLWVLVIIFVPNFLGLVIYLIVRSNLNNKEKCLQCGRIIEKDYNICPYCKSEVKNRCPSCNRVVSNDWKVCPSCGEEIDLDVNMKNSSDKNLRIIVILSICIIILPVILFFIVFASGLVTSNEFSDNTTMNYKTGSLTTNIGNKYTLSAKYINGNDKSKIIKIKEDGVLTLESNIDFESGHLLAYIYNINTLDKYEIVKGSNITNITANKGEKYQIVLECDDVKSLKSEFIWNYGQIQ